MITQRHIGVLLFAVWLLCGALLHAQVSVYHAPPTLHGLGLQAFANELAVTAKPYNYAIAEGDITGHTRGFKVGYNPDVDNASETIWQVGGMYVPATQATKLQVFSTSTNDTAGGTGARSVAIIGLDANLLTATETVVTNGVGRVETANVYKRVNYFYVASAGALLTTGGQIDLVRTGGTQVYRRILTGLANDAGAFFTVPANLTGYITDWSVSCAATALGHYIETRLRATCNESGILVTDIFQLKDNAMVMDGVFERHFTHPLKIPGGTDIQITVISDGGSANVIVMGSMEGWME